MVGVAGIVMTTERELMQFLVERMPIRFQGLFRRLGLAAAKTD